MKKIISLIILLSGLLFLAFIFVSQNNKIIDNDFELIDSSREIIKIKEKEISDIDGQIIEKTLPPKDEIINNVIPEPVVEEDLGSKILPSKVLMDVDFTSQAPFRDWSQPWQDTCEEAAVLITMRYFDGRGIISKEDTRDALLQIIEWEDENFGFHKDTSASTTMAIIKGFYGYDNVQLSTNITVESIKKELANGNLIILPTAGKILKNPYFTPPGPVYHQIVLIGYDDNAEIFYANDPGIMSGGKFKYSYDNIMDAIADWDYVTGTIDMNRRVIIIVRKP